MVGQNLNPSSIDDANAAESASSARPWWRSLQTAAVRVMDELVVGFGICGASVYIDPSGESPAHEISAKSRAVRVPERAGSGGLNLAPASPEGARVVLHELRRASATIHLAAGSRARGAKSPSTLGAIVLALGVLT